MELLDLVHEASSDAICCADSIAGPNTSSHKPAKAAKGGAEQTPGPASPSTVQRHCFQTPALLPHRHALLSLDATPAKTRGLSNRGTEEHKRCRR